MLVLAHLAGQQGRPRLEWSRLLGDWDTSAQGLALLLLETAIAAAYLLAAQRRSGGGQRWPWQRTALFLGGLAAIAIALQSGLAAYDSSLVWAHATQHALLMMVAPLLLAYGAPVTLALRASGPELRRALVGVLGDPAVSGLMRRRWAPAVLGAEYYGSMAVFLLTGWYAASLDHDWLHELTHGYFLACGLAFWLPVTAVDPVRHRMPARVRRQLLAAGMPINIALGAILLTRSTPLSDHNALGDTRAAGWVFVLVGPAVSVAGLAMQRRRDRRTARPDRARAASPRDEERRSAHAVR